MALQTLPQQSSTSGLLDMVNLLSKGTDLLSGKSQTTKSTTSSSISQDAMNAMLKSILEGTNGLAQVTSGQKAAGLYNSSVNTLLANDLLARSASEVAQQNRTSTTTSTTKTAAPTKGSTLLGLFGTAQLLGSLFGGGGSDSTGKKTKSIWDDISGIFGGGSETTTTSDSSSISSLFSGGSSSGGVGDLFSGGASTLGAIGTAYTAYNDIQNDNWGGAIGTAAGSYFGPAGAAAGQFIGTAADTYLGPVVQDVWKGAGDVVTDVVGGIGDLVTGKDCFITTAVCEKFGWPDDCAILTTLRTYRDTFLRPNPAYSPFVIQYYNEAPEIVRIIKTFSPVDQEVIWTDCYENYILPAVREIEQGNNETAFNIYSELFNMMHSHAYQNWGVTRNG